MKKTAMRLDVFDLFLKLKREGVISEIDRGIDQYVFKITGSENDSFIDVVKRSFYKNYFYELTIDANVRYFTDLSSVEAEIRGRFLENAKKFGDLADEIDAGLDGT